MLAATIEHRIVPSCRPFGLMTTRPTGSSSKVRGPSRRTTYGSTGSFAPLLEKIAAEEWPARKLMMAREPGWDFADRERKPSTGFGDHRLRYSDSGIA
jgi:hypothetical protein